MEIRSELIEKAVDQIAKLPGIGKKSALRLVLKMIKEDPEYTSKLAESLQEMRENIKRCQSCHLVSDTGGCICQPEIRDRTVICVIEDYKDFIAIESTGQYNGLYHILDGIINPIRGIGPSDLNIDSLFDRIKSASDPVVKEVILALPASMEGETTSFYLARKLNALGVFTSTIARGIPVGSDLEYADEITLGRSIQRRTHIDL